MGFDAKQFAQLQENANRSRQKATVDERTVAQGENTSKSFSVSHNSANSVVDVLADKQTEDKPTSKPVRARKAAEKAPEDQNGSVIPSRAYMRSNGVTGGSQPGEESDNVMTDSGAEAQRTAFVLDKLIRGDVSELVFENDTGHQVSISFRRWGYDIVLTIKQTR